MAKKKEKYVLLTDVVGSRRITNRADFEKRLAPTLRQVQKKWDAVFEMPIQVWKGLDETAALLNRPEQLYNVITEIDAGIAPQYMRFVLVKGPLDVVPQSGRVSDADGPAFHTAAAQMLLLKKSGLRFSCDTGHPMFDTAWAQQVNLLLLLKQNWTSRQRTIYNLYCESGRQDEVAQVLAVSQQSISAALQSIATNQVQELEKRLAEWTALEFKNHVLD